MARPRSDADLRKARSQPRFEEGGPVKVRREVRRGKPVTTIFNLPLDDAGLRELAARLKKRCGVGGSAKDGVIELQGDHRDVVIAELEAAGHRVVRAGG
jgi:translation initiation factor 1